MKEHLLGRQGEVEELESQLAESKAENQDIEDKYADLAADLQELQQKLASEVRNIIMRLLCGFCLSLLAVKNLVLSCLMVSFSASLYSSIWPCFALLICHFQMASALGSDDSLL